MAKKKNKWIWWLVVSLILASALFYFNVLQEQLVFEEGFEPYGESSFSITGLEKNVDEEYPTANWPDNWRTKFVIDKGKYWTFKREFDKGQKLAGVWKTYYGGNDFRIKFTADRSWAHQVKAISTGDFSNKEFKTTIVLRASDESSSGFSIHGFGYSESLRVYDNQGQTKEFNIHLKPSPISNKITLFVNGEEIKSIDRESYNFGITATMNNYGRNGIVILKNPRWREQFSCSKEPDEQYYFKAFKEGDVMELSDFDNLNKFCLTHPVTIYTSSGSTTTKEPLLGMVEEDKSYTIPPGQIWTVQYIGDIQDPETACESGEVYDLDTEDCYARTIITYDFLLENKTLETEKVEYEPVDTSVHQSFENSKEFTFKHIINDGESSDNSITIGENNFVSNYVRGSFMFKYKGITYNASKVNNIKLDDYLTVNVDNIEDDKDPPGSYNDASIKYDFSLDTGFLKTSVNMSKKLILVNNTYQDFNGGLILTKTDKLETTTVEERLVSINEGVNKYYYTEDLRDIRAKPFVIVDTPNYDYKLEAIIKPREPQIQISKFINNLWDWIKGLF